MARKAYVGIDGKARRCRKVYVGVENKARRVRKAYIGVNGVARCCFACEPVYYGQISVSGYSGMVRSQTIASCSIDGYAIFAGGEKAYTYYSDALAYNSELTSISIPNLTHGASYAAGAGFGNKAFISGGYYSPYQSIASCDTVNCYVDFTKTQVEELGERRYEHWGASFGERVMFSPGRCREGESAAGAKVTGTNAADIYDNELTHSRLNVQNNSYIQGLCASIGDSVAALSYDFGSSGVIFDNNLTRTYFTAPENFDLFTAASTPNGAFFVGQSKGIYIDPDYTGSVFSRSISNTGVAACGLKDYVLVRGAELNSPVVTDYFDDSLTRHAILPGNSLSVTRCSASVGDYGLFPIGSPNSMDAGALLLEAYRYE